jgi:hypothetical protein
MSATIEKKNVKVVVASILQPVNNFPVFQGNGEIWSHKAGGHLIQV